MSATVRSQPGSPPQGLLSVAVCRWPSIRQGAWCCTPRTVCFSATHGACRGFCPAYASDGIVESRAYAGGLVAAQLFRAHGSALRVLLVLFHLHARQRVGRGYLGGRILHMHCVGVWYHAGSGNGESRAYTGGLVA